MHDDISQATNTLLDDAALEAACGAAWTPVIIKVTG